MKPYLRLSVLLLSLIITACQITPPSSEKQSGAGEAMDLWARIRSYPDGRLQSRKIYEAFLRQRQQPVLRNTITEWTALGPKNIGGRTLCLAFHPNDPSVIFAGSASGGLWKTTTAGAGVDAWERIPTGFPVQAVGAIAIDPENPEVMYLGTGEVYNYTAAQPGTYDRLTRGFYGFGILKSTDGGETWALSMDWTDTELRAVWKIAINPQNTQTVFAATTEGVFRSYDGGDSWQSIHEPGMAMDLELNPVDTNVLFVAHGGYLSPDRGVYRSIDGGETFTLLTGLPTDYGGKTMLALSPSTPEIIYASVAEPFESIGLFRSTDNGDNWVMVNTEDIAMWQGWYSHDVAVQPTNPNTLLYGGIDVHRSTNGGPAFSQVSEWYLWYFGQVPVGGPEGPPNYVHADIHGLYFHPAFDNVAYAATDGGIFASINGGQTWEGRNGGYQTQQFYANFSNSTTNPDLAMGGMQDNATAIYTGDDAWTRVIGGDGMCTAIHPEFDEIRYGSSQRLNIRRSIAGSDFEFLDIYTAQGESRCFNGPFELAPGQPNILYAGAQRLHVSPDGGDEWAATSPDFVDQGNPILSIAVGPADPDLLYISTAPFFSEASLLKSTDGGATWINVGATLPDRVVTDIAISPLDPQTVYITFSGFGSPHLFGTTDGGLTWLPLGAGQLPDVPANTILIDPLLPDHLFVGNDLGVYASLDGGATWEFFSADLPDATLVMHLSLSADRQLRAATHGNGVWQTLLPEPVASSSLEKGTTPFLGQNFPNPAVHTTTIPVRLPTAAAIELQLLNGRGRQLRTLGGGAFPAGEHAFTVDLSELPAGIYHYLLTGQITAGGEKIRELRRMVVKH